MRPSKTKINIGIPQSGHVTIGYVLCKTIWILQGGSENLDRTRQNSITIGPHLAHKSLLMLSHDGSFLILIVARGLILPVP